MFKMTPWDHEAYDAAYANFHGGPFLAKHVATFEYIKALNDTHAEKVIATNVSLTAISNITPDVLDYAINGMANWEITPDSYVMPEITIIGFWAP